MKESFVAVAACSGEEALSALHDASWDLQAAIKAFLSGDPGRILFDGLPVAAGGGGDRAEQAREQGAAARDQARDRADATERRSGEESGHVAAGGQERPSHGGEAGGAARGGGGLEAGGGNSKGDGQHVELPDGWERRYDASSSRFYYANQATRTTVRTSSVILAHFLLFLNFFLFLFLSSLCLSRCSCCCFVSSTASVKASMII
jgi:hypothetical protein